MERFWNKVNKTITCWEWLGSLSSNGYGNFFYEGKNHRAHRFSYMLNKGEITNNLLVCHICDNKKCVNPEHLFLGTNSDNLKDSYIKGRKTLKGYKSLTIENIELIKSLLQKGLSVKDILKQVNTSKNIIYLIKINKY